MKQLKKKQLGPWCSYCPSKTTRAIYRQDGFGGNFCCEEHKDELRQDEKAENDELTEADYQTWMRL